MEKRTKAKPALPLFHCWSILELVSTFQTVWSYSLVLADWVSAQVAQIWSCNSSIDGDITRGKKVLQAFYRSVSKITMNTLSHLHQIPSMFARPLIGKPNVTSPKVRSVGPTFDLLKQTLLCLTSAFVRPKRSHCVLIDKTVFCNHKRQVNTA